MARVLPKSDLADRIARDLQMSSETPHLTPQVGRSRMRAARRQGRQNSDVNWLLGTLQLLHQLGLGFHAGCHFWCRSLNPGLLAQTINDN